MIVYSLEVTRHNVLSSLKFLRNTNYKLYWQTRNLTRNFTMSQKPSRQGSYISINVPETANHATRRRFFSVFRKKTPHSETSAQGTKNAEIRRLLALAKPEKWKIICRYTYTIVWNQLYNFACSVLGAIGFLLVSSTVTMAIPYSLGKILDVVYKDKPDGATADEAKQNLFKITTILMGVFVLGAVCNFGRIYFMSIASK